MSVTYTELMAMSRAQTKASDAAAQSVLAQRQRKLDEQRKEQEAREKRDKEVELRIRKMRLEEQAREQERLVQLEQQRQAKERLIAQKEAQQRDRLLHGNKHSRSKSESGRSNDRGRDGAGGGSGSGNRSRRASSSPEPGIALTREELREQKRASEHKRLYSGSSGSPRRSSTPSHGNSRSRNHLRGGAVPIVTTTPGIPTKNGSDLVGMSHQSVKERISAVPLTLTKLNTVKRDLRTIDEILVDRDKARNGETKVISGEEAKEFSDWFNKTKKKDASKAIATPPGTPGGPTLTTDDSLKQRPASRSPAPSSLHEATSMRSSSVPSSMPSIKSTNLQKSKNGSQFQPSAKLSNSQPAFTKSSISLSGKVTPSASFSKSSPLKRRPRSPSLSPEPLPKKSRPTSYLPDDIYELITGGRNRERYTGPIDDSDDSDMEADAASQEREELWSERIARREDEEAAEELRLHEEEKLKKKKLREAQKRSL